MYVKYGIDSNGETRLFIDMRKVNEAVELEKNITSKLGNIFAKPKR